MEGGKVNNFQKSLRNTQAIRVEVRTGGSVQVGNRKHTQNHHKQRSKEKDTSD